MANAYGSKGYKEYRKWYEEKEYKLEEESSYRLDEIEVKLDFYKWIGEEDGIQRSSEKTEQLFTFPDGRTYRAVCMDCFTFDPCIVELEGEKFLMFKRDLYGYTLLNVRTFEEINYFPANVLSEDEEAYIITEARQLRDLLILDGCYWGTPYFYYFLDLTTFKAVDVYKLIKQGIYVDDWISIDGDLLTLRDCNGELIEFTYDKLKNAIAEKGDEDL